MPSGARLQRDEQLLHDDELRASHDGFAKKRAASRPHVLAWSMAGEAFSPKP
jgi:hypothetical protein